MKTEKKVKVIQEFVPEITEEVFTLEVSKEELQYLFCAAGSVLPSDVLSMAKQHNFTGTSFEGIKSLTKASTPIYNQLKELLDAKRSYE